MTTFTVAVDADRRPQASRHRIARLDQVYAPLTGQRGSQIRRAVSIAKRRVDVADRLVPGDWEGDGGEIRDAVRAQVRAFREVLPQQSVHVLVRDTLPRALRIAAVHSQSRVNPGLRDNAAAIDALEQATKAGEIWTSIHPLTDRIFDELRGDARFASLLERVGLSGISTQQGPRVTWRH